MTQSGCKCSMSLCVLLCIVGSSRSFGALLSDKSAGRVVMSMTEAVDSLLSGENVGSISDFVRENAKTVDFEKAARSLEHRHALPQELLALVRKSTSNSTSFTSLSEASLEKARDFLNELTFKSYIELDSEVIECKAQENKNRGEEDQVVADIARLGSELANHKGRQSSASTCASDFQQKIDQQGAIFKTATSLYETQIENLRKEFQAAWDDLEVFDFLLNVTKDMCDSMFSEVDGLFLVDVHDPKVKKHAPLDPKVKKHAPLQVCKTAGGPILRFNDNKVSKILDELLAKSTLRKYHGDRIRGRSSFLQQLQPLDISVPVVTEAGEDFANVKCAPPEDCGLLYDTLSLKWGKFKDNVDSLRVAMDKRNDERNTEKTEFERIDGSLRAGYSKCSQEISEATADINMAEEEISSKEERKNTLDRDHANLIETCKVRIKYIMHQQICSYIVIRNKVMETSTECQPELIEDCEMTPWQPGECDVPCDDACPGATSKDCGGEQDLTRTIIQQENKCGVMCGALTKKRRCNQVKCPVNCEMSIWSGWSKCSRECDSGVRVRTRSIEMMPKNGGEGCKPITEDENCNTGSCDKNCELYDWTVWGPCSMACETGVQKRFRHVMVPIRANGECEKEDSDLRYEERTCNTQDCPVQLCCGAKQDLVMALDGSGSINSLNFTTIKMFAKEIALRYIARYEGADAMQIGAVLFGNGAVVGAGGVVAPAIVLHKVCEDREAVAKALYEAQHQGGFTNMAQGLLSAQKIILAVARKDAFSGVMVLTDGAPSFVYETERVIDDLESDGIMRYMVPITEVHDQRELMESWASKPFEVNSVHIPGVESLGLNMEDYTKDCIKTFCPLSASCKAIDPTFPLTPMFRQSIGTFYGGIHKRDNPDEYRGEERGITVSCAAGETMIGGGCEAWWPGDSDTCRPSPDRPNAYQSGSRGSYTDTWVVCVPETKTEVISTYGNIANCPSGHHVLGGGCYATSNQGDWGEARIRKSAPADDAKGWICEGVADNMQSYAVCSDAVETTVRKESGSQSFVSAKCPEGEVLLSGGCEAEVGYFMWNTPAKYSWFQDSYGITDDSWLCGYSGSKTTYIVCAPAAEQAQQSMTVP